MASPIRFQVPQDTTTIKKDSVVVGTRDSVSTTNPDSGKDTHLNVIPKPPAPAKVIKADKIEETSTTVADTTAIDSIYQNSKTKEKNDSLAEERNHYIRDLIFTPAQFEKEELTESMFNAHLLQTEGVRPEIHPYGKPWISFVLLSVFAAVSFAKYFSSKKLSLLFSTLTDNRGVVQIANDENELPSLLKLNLTIIYFVISSLFIMQVMTYHGIRTGPELKSPIMLILMGSFACYYLFKTILLKLVALVFDARKPIAEHFAINNAFNGLTGLLLFPLVVSLQYASSSYQGALINTGIILLLVFWAYRIVRILISGWGLSYISKTHLFIYLCTLEILPILILYRIIKLTFDI